MLTSFPTLTPNTDVLPQWADFSVTAPSGLVPTGFYDGTETVTVTWWIEPWFNWLTFIDKNIRSNSSNWWVVSSLYNSVWMYDDWSDMYSFVEYDNWAWNKYIVVIVLDKPTNWVTILTEWWYTSWNVLVSVYYDLWNVYFNLNNLPSPLINIYYNIASNTWSSRAWHTTSWVLLNTTIPYLWYTLSWFTLFTWWIVWRFLSWFNLS